jgi:hypothetical protein
MSINKGSLFPIQMLPLSKKDKNWRIKCIDALVSRHKRRDERHSRMKLSYNILNSKFDMRDFKYVVDPFNVSEGFPAKIQNINIIRPKIEHLKGEFIKRPKNCYVFQTDERAVETMIDKEKEMLYQAFQASLNIQDESKASEYLKTRLSEIKSFMSSKYYCPAEQTANASLKYLKELLDMDRIFLTTFEDALAAGESIHYVGIRNGNVIAERVNPLTASYDRDPNLRFIEDGEWFVREMLMTTTEIHDEFKKILDEKDYKALQDRTSNDTAAVSSASSTGSNINTKYIEYVSDYGLNTLDWVEDNRKGALVTVYHCVWKTQKKIGYLTYQDEETGEVVTTIVDETYKKQDNESIEWDWISEIWEGYKFWNDIYSEIGPIAYQGTTMESPNAKKLPFIGAPFSTNNTDGKSLVEIMKPLQYFYLIIMFRLEQAIARDAGKVILMDITQIPKSQGIEPDKWLHYLKSIGVAFVNPYEEGWNIPGREGGKPSVMNQMTSLDLSMSNVINEYIMLMNKIEEMIGEISGITEQRQGQISSSELVGNVQRSIVQSSHSTEPIFNLQERIIKNVYTYMLNTAKFAWRNSDKKYINYVLDGPSRTFINITEDFLYSDYDVFVSNSSKEGAAIDALKGLYQPAMQNGATLLDIATILNSDNLSDIKMKLEEIEKRREANMQAVAEKEQATLDFENKLKLDANRIQEEDSIRKAETSIQTALIQANSNNNTSELPKLDLQKQKIQQDFDIKNKQLEESSRHNKESEKISNKKSNSNK